MEKKSTIIHGITSDEIAMLRKTAEKLGFLLERGPGTGETGSVSALIRAIARSPEALRCLETALQQQN